MHASLQPENALILPKWTGDPNDKTLVSLIPFLEYLANLDVADVRTVLASFTPEQRKDLPAEFHRRQQLARDRFETARKNSLGSKSSSGGGFLSNMLGLKPSMAGAPGGMVMINPETGEPEPTFGEEMARGKDLQDQIREREIQKNGEQWLKDMKAEDEKFQKEAMDQMKKGATSWFRLPFGSSGQKAAQETQGTSESRVDGK